jgi:tetratricopeptide (TPR) repeat protein
MLADESRGVRSEAARVLSSVESTAMRPAYRALWLKAIEEYQSGMQEDLDQAAAHLSLGILDERLAMATWNLHDRSVRLEEAIKNYRNAIRVQPDVTGPRSNLAALLESLGRTEESATLRKEELPLLERDARYAPREPLLQYRFGLTLYLTGDMDRAIEVIRQSCELAPDNVEFRYMLARLLERNGQISDAKEHSLILLRAQPQNEIFLQLHRSLNASTLTPSDKSPR